jgi:hypothetical protein
VVELPKSERINRAGMIEVQRQAHADADLLVWTIYAMPSDFPQSYVVRPFSSKYGKGLTVHFEHPQLNAVRGALERMGLVRLDRQEGDDANIVETWL